MRIGPRRRRDESRIHAIKQADERFRPIRTGALMNYSFKDLIDLTVLQDLCENFSKIAHTATAVLDLDGTVLIASGWRDICTRFHRVHPTTASRCIQSDTVLAGQSSRGEPYNVYRCQNGLVDVAVPITVDGTHIGNLFIGQFFFEPPDIEFFRNQAAEFGFDEAAYLAALSAVPIFSEEDVRRIIDCLCQLAEVIGETSLAKLRLLESNEKLKREIRERKKAEAALANQSALLDNVLSTIPHGIFWKDRNSVYLGCNDVFAEATGLGNSKNIVGKTDDDLPWQREEAEHYLRCDREVMEQGIPMLDIEETLTQADGRQKTIVTSKVPLRDKDGGILGLLGIFYDITERKLAEAERNRLEEQLRRAQKMEAIGTLAGGIAHDFNNILQAISGYTQILLLDRAAADPGYHELRTIQGASERAGQLVQQLLTFSRQVESQRRPIDINREVRLVRTLLERTIPRMIDIELRLAADLHSVNADPAQIEQLLMNLGTNARDAMLHGGRLLIETSNITLGEDDASTVLDVHPGRYVLLAVSDTGVGMDRHTVEHIFDPFFTTKEIGKGTGLGLASAYGIVKSHGGNITCDSEVGRGTTFKIYLPALESIGASLKEAVPEPTLPGGDETILVVDDEEWIRDLARQMLQRVGYHVIVASSGEAALDVYGDLKDRIDLVILDLSMPGMGGHRCFQQMQRINPSVKAVFASGYLYDGAVKDMVEFEAAGYLGKPYQFTDLLHTVRQILDFGRV